MAKPDDEAKRNIKNLSDLSGSNVSEKVESAIGTDGVVLFTKETCPFCIEVRRTFDGLGVNYAEFQVTGTTEGGAAWDELKKKYGQKTVPYVFVNKELIGGCDATKKLQSEGLLTEKLEKAGWKPSKQAALCGVAPEDSAAARHARLKTGIFQYPEIIDDRVARFGSFAVFVSCILIAIFHQKKEAQWCMVGLMCEYAVKLIGGGTMTPTGSFGIFCAACSDALGFKPKWKAGVPNQFAMSCGLTFSTLASLFYLISVYNYFPLQKVGLAFTCGLGFAAMLESCFGFCLGCFFFGLGVQFGIVPAEVYSQFVNALPDHIYAYNYANGYLNEGKPAPITVHIHEGVDLDTDFKGKLKTDDMIKEEFNPVKHCKITHWAMHMGIAGLACAWKLCAQITLCSDTPWHVIAVTGAALNSIWTLLYFAKCFRYPQRVCKEWNHVTYGNAFAMWCTTLVLYAYLVESHDLTLAQVIFWVGAGSNMAITIFRVGFWIATKKDYEHLNATWIVVPVSNFVAAFVGPILAPEYRKAMQFYYAVAFMSFFLLLPTVFLKAIVSSEDEDRLRPSLAVFVAAPSVLGLAYLKCFPPFPKGMPYTPDMLRSSQAESFIFINANWFAVAMSLMLAVGFVFKPFFCRMKFDMAYWDTAFSSAALAMTTGMYADIVRGNLSYGIFYAALAVTSAAHAGMTLQTLAALVRWRVFNPEQKWGPISFMRLMHEAFRNAIHKMEETAKAGSTPALNSQLSQQYEAFEKAMHAHSQHEDLVFFAHYKELFGANICHDADEEHHDLHEVVFKDCGAAVKLGGEAALKGMEPGFRAIEKHLKGEEDRLGGIPRKYVNIVTQKRLVREAWNTTPAEEWRTLLPWIINTLPMMPQRVRFVKTLIWSMPERDQYFGILIANGVDAVMWKRLTDELPEIIPRGMEGHIKHY